ncbi:PGRS family protein [Sorangium sp. So ce128]|uniref:PGRS family protein n=1 Tax=Sorangium sp. So ce128 TaxID=3133281 RepID=UPI003F620A25
MRRRAHFASMILLSMTAIGVIHAGCIVSLEYSDEKYDQPPIHNPTLSGCEPSKRDTWTAATTCGVFVSHTQGHDDNDGTPEQPVKSLKRALLLAESNRKHVYACAEEFDGAVEVPAGTTLYGGLTCDKTENGLDWHWVNDTTRTKISAPAGTIPLKIIGKNSPEVVHLENVHVIAPKGVPQDGPAKPELSSIAAVASTVRLVELRHSTLEAVDAAPGFDEAQNEEPASAGAKGNSGKDACSESTVNGGEPTSNRCDTLDEADDSFGGAGGAGRPDNGGRGDQGTPGTENGGLGQVGTNSCAPGLTGVNGTNGDPGNGATDDGSITPEGYIGASGAPGTPGTTAQGGGGGGGARGVPMSTTSPPRACPDGTPPLGGASGGSGGAGGCGGAGGRGGGPGGASIALISINTEFLFDNVTIKTGNGGKGGNGGPGQNGGMGGMGGPRGEAPDGSSNLLHGCDGGPGGTGGNGGTGGGGRGGHSVGIAFQGKPPALTGVTFELGTAGDGGAGSDADHNGKKGLREDRLEF